MRSRIFSIASIALEINCFLLKKKYRKINSKSDLGRVSYIPPFPFFPKMGYPFKVTVTQEWCAWRFKILTCKIGMKRILSVNQWLFRLSLLFIYLFSTRFFGFFFCSSYTLKSHIARDLVTDRHDISFYWIRINHIIISLWWNWSSLN